MFETGNVSRFTLLIGRFIRKSLSAKRSKLLSIMLLLTLVSPVEYSDLETPTSFWLTIESYLVVMAVCVFIPLRYKFRSRRVLPNAKLNNDLTLRQAAILAQPEPANGSSRLLDVEILEALQTDVVRFCIHTETLVPSNTTPNADQQNLVAALVAHNGRFPSFVSGFPPSYIKDKNR